MTHPYCGVAPTQYRIVLVLCNQYFEVSHLLSPVFTGQDDVGKCPELPLALTKLLGIGYRGGSSCGVSDARVKFRSV